MINYLVVERHTPSLPGAEDIVGVRIPFAEQPSNEFLNHTPLKLGNDPYLSRLRDWFIYLTGGIAFLTSVLGLSYSYAATKLVDLQGRVTNCEQAVLSQVNNLAEQVGELKVGAGSISQRLEKAEGKLGKLTKINDKLSEIVDALDKGGEIGEYRIALEALSQQSSQL